ncbi:MAG TPA: hypothetical protein VKC15_17030 [Gemmatimonadales bacterium]|nr:hypothetical protein [Gemmatimonadales bacterium]
MRYWTGLLIAVVFDAAVIAGPNSRAPEPRIAVCAEQTSPDAEIGCLARAIQLDPYRRDLWVALDHAVERSGRATVTDAELTRLALRFSGRRSS